MTTTLSDAQRYILTAAAATDEGLVRPEHVSLKGGAVRAVLTSMLKRGLLEELAAGEGDHGWWCNAADEPLTLRMTDAGAEAIGSRSDTALPRTEVAGPADSAKAAPKAFRADTKQAALIALLQRKEGATIDEMAAVTGWMSHTVRGAMAGALKKRLGLEIRSERVQGRGRVYRLGS